MRHKEAIMIPVRDVAEEDLMLRAGTILGFDVASWEDFNTAQRYVRWIDFQRQGFALMDTPEAQTIPRWRRSDESRPSRLTDVLRGGSSVQECQGQGELRASSAGCEARMAADSPKTLAERLRDVSDMKIPGPPSPSRPPHHHPVG